MQRISARVALAGGLLFAVAAFAVLLMSVVGGNSGVSAAGPTPTNTPGPAPTPKSTDHTGEVDGIFDIVVMDATGQNPVQVTSGAGHNENPQWSADARKIVFSSTRTGRKQIYMMNVDGSDVVALTDGVESFNPAAGPHPRR